MQMRHETPLRQRVFELYARLTPLACVARRYAMLTLAAAIFLMVVLSGCSTPRVETPPMIPPPGSMFKAKPLPVLKEPATVTDLVINDLKVVEMYHDLAIRHNALVDWTWEQIEAEQRRVGAGK